ncbi:MAG: phosphohydrolase [Desulfovibrionaceae bacterium]|nr:phosphohydrolase [Desulfovibrionaceae bacterium]
MFAKLSEKLPGLLRAPMPWEEMPLPRKGLLCSGPVPGEESCVELWNFYQVPEHIRRHSELVAAYALHLGNTLHGQGVRIDLPGLYASALLHDIAKMHCVQHGGSHAQVGAAWVVQKTGQHLLAQGVLFHVYWPWPLCFESWPLPLLIEYADKRVMHDRFVSLNERFEDLMLRYGHNEEARERTRKIECQARELEQLLAKKYKVDVNANFTYSWRLV